MLELVYLPNSDFGWNAMPISLHINGTASTIFLFLFLSLVCWWNVVRDSSEAAEDARQLAPEKFA
jgi:hypothetical protein